MRKALVGFLVTIAALIGMVGCGTNNNDSKPTATATATMKHEATTTNDVSVAPTSSRASSIERREDACFEVIKVALSSGDDSDVMPKECVGLSDEVIEHLAEQAYEAYWVDQGWEYVPRH